MKLPVLIFDFGNVVGFFDYSVMFRPVRPAAGQERRRAGGLDVRARSRRPGPGIRAREAHAPRSLPGR